MNARPLSAVVVPAAPGLLPSRGAQDPFAPVRAAAVAALVEALAGVREVSVLGSPVEKANADRGVVFPLSLRIAHHLLDLAEWDGPRHECVLPALPLPADLMVVPADGSARRSEKAPGHFDDRAAGFDAAIEEALATGDAAALRALDEQLGEDLLVGGIPALRTLGALVPQPARARLLYADDPFGVRYWVARWEA